MSCKEPTAKEAEPESEGTAGEPETRRQTPWLRRIPLRSPTLPPAEHTNVYVVGEGELLVCDPGTPDRAENDRLLAELGRLSSLGHKASALFVTHHHNDHVSGAAYLRERLGVPLLAHRRTAEKLGRQLTVDRLVEDGEVLPYGPGGFTARLTPGHAPGHLCLFDGASANALVGDMVASVGTILISPSDDGDLGLYLASLRGLLGPAQERQLRLWPAHGASVKQGAELLQFYLGHRLQREEKVVAALRRGPATVAALIPLVYDDKPGTHPWLAAESIGAHLQKLLVEQRARVDGERGLWELAF